MYPTKPDPEWQLVSFNVDSTSYTINVSPTGIKPEGRILMRVSE